MPTIIALDTSLSMHRPVPGRSEENPLTYNQLAVKSISHLLEHFAGLYKLEYLAVVSCGSNCELKVDFTRDYDLVRQTVKKLEMSDKMCCISMLKTITSIFNSSWGTQSGCNVVLFTDAGLCIGKKSLFNFVQKYQEQPDAAEFEWLNSTRGICFNLVCMGVQNDVVFTHGLQQYQKLLDVTKLKGKIYTTKSKDTATDAAQSDLQVASYKSELGRTVMFELIERLCEQCFKPFEATLKCGAYMRLEAQVLLWPTPVVYVHKETGLQQTCLTDKLISAVGILPLSDIGSPASIGRHLLLSKPEQKHNRRFAAGIAAGGSVKPTTTTTISSNKSQSLDVHPSNSEVEKLEKDIRDFYSKDAKDSDESGDDTETNTTNKSSSVSNAAAIVPESQRECLCVLLHSMLKMENMAMLVTLGKNWYGFIYPHADCKKRSNLMLNILPPGNNVIPWLGDLSMLGFAEDLLPGESAQFPVKSEKRSYSQSCVVWIRYASLQSDVQKVMRHAKKMPEKTTHFYKELNRIRKAALSIGFVELLEAMAALFEKESSILALNTHPECSIQLKHAAMELRKPGNRDTKVAIQPMPKFGSIATDISYAQ